MATSLNGTVYIYFLRLEKVRDFCNLIKIQYSLRHLSIECTKFKNRLFKVMTKNCPNRIVLIYVCIYSE